MITQEKVDVRDADGHPGTLDVWVSDGESDPGQTIMEASLPGEYLMICLDLDAAKRLRRALDRMIQHHYEHPASEPDLLTVMYAE